MIGRRRDPDSWTVVRLPERDLADSVLDLASPLLTALGPKASLDEAWASIEIAVAFWNASVEASALWNQPSQKSLRALRKRLGTTRIADGGAPTFDVLAQRWRERFRLEPRLVEAWTYEVDAHGGARRLTCEMGLPEGVRAEVPPPIENRIAIGGQFLDEVKIRATAQMFVSFPVSEHRAVIATDGTATVYARAPTALQLFAEGRLPRVAGEAVDLLIGGRTIGSMVLSEVSCGGESHRYDVAVLVFRPSSGAAA